MTIKFNRWLVLHGGYFVGVFFGYQYVIRLFTSDLQSYLELAASLLIIFSLFTGLSFGFSSVIQTPADKETAAYAGEKFFFATICMALSGLAGFGSMIIDSATLMWLWPWVKVIAVSLLQIFALLYLASAAGAIIHGHNSLTELFLVRWNRRLIGSDKNEP